jgi:hypothetical protein
MKQSEKSEMPNPIEAFLERFKPFKEKFQLHPSSYQIREEDGSPGKWIARVDVWELHAEHSIVTPFWPSGYRRYDSEEAANSAALWEGLEWLEQGRPAVKTVE